MKITLEQIARHRNGVSGAPFHITLFRDEAERLMLGIVFDEPTYVAVLDLQEAAAGNIAFGSNSWRGDRYESSLREAVKSPVEDGVVPSHLDLNRLHTERKEIGVVWMIDDVTSIRPDLTEEQAWAVLLEADRYHDATIGINWDVLHYHAQSLFGDAPKDGEADE